MQALSLRQPTLITSAWDMIEMQEDKFPRPGAKNIIFLAFSPPENDKGFFGPGTLEKTNETFSH